MTSAYTSIILLASATAMSVRENIDMAGVECVTLSSEIHFVSRRNLSIMCLLTVVMR
jgi:hypothetical protein